MDLIVKRIINNPIDSNCYVIYSGESVRCIVVDPGSKNNSKLLSFLKEKDLNIEYIVLTHEHFDHIWGVNDLKSRYNAKIISTKLCGEKIVNKKKNMSVFYDKVGFECYPSDISIESISNVLLWNDVHFQFIKTPGHTDCCMSLVFSNKIFVGDLIIPGFKTVTKLPSGNKKALLDSLNFILENYMYNDFEVYPGHGNKFWRSSIELKNIFE